MSGIDERAGDSREMVVVKNRIPFEYFVTEGTGQSNNQIHAGSYHLALRAANIEHLNVMKYSSILPEMAKEVRGFDPRTITHGSVLETISAESSCEKGRRATAAIIWAKLRDTAGRPSKGLVCEYSGNSTIVEARENLEACLRELYENGYEHLKLEPKDIRFRASTITPEKKYGTALVVIGFVSHAWPIKGIMDKDGKVRAAEGVLYESTR